MMNGNTQTPDKDNASFGLDKTEKDAGVVATKEQVQLAPNEMLAHMFTFLPLQDRFQAKLVCANWNSLIRTQQTLWREEIRKHFPYLVTNEAFYHSPYDLFTRECEYYRDIIKKQKYEFKLKDLLAKLRGDLSEVKNISSENQKILFSFAIANGHDAALKLVDNTGPFIVENDYIVKAFCIAAENGYLDVVKHLEPKIRYSVNFLSGLYLAAERGYLDVVKFLTDKLFALLFLESKNFQSSGIATVSIEHQMSQIWPELGRIASQYGQINILMYVLDKGNYLQSEMFVTAAEHGQLAMVKCLLRINNWSIETKDKASCRAFEKAHSDIVLCISRDKNGKQQGSELKGLANAFNRMRIEKKAEKEQQLEHAVESGDLGAIKNVIKSEDISFEKQQRAFNRAIEKNYLDIVTYFLEGPTRICVIDAPEACCLAAQHGHLEMMIYLLPASDSQESRDKLIEKAAAFGQAHIIQYLNNSSSKISASDLAKLKK